jgi:uncharacterized protein YggT (Ycf19 family)
MLKHINRLLITLLAHDLRPLIALLVCIGLIMVVAYLLKS